MEALQGVMGFSMYVGAWIGLIYAVRAIGRIAKSMERIAKHMEQGESPSTPL